MCEQDVKIGKESFAASIPLTLSTTSQLAIDQDDERMTLVLCGNLTAVTTYSMATPAVIGAGINIPAGGQPVILDLKNHGRLTTERWNVVVAAGTPLTEIHYATRVKPVVGT